MTRPFRFIASFPGRFRTRFPTLCAACRQVLAAIMLGGAGFGLNLLELQLGWGMHFVFGNALIFAFLRTLRPATLVAAVSLSSLRTVFLWHHPWAWAIWTLEAGALSAGIRRTSPIQIDVAFWLVAGTPLLVLTYGGLMGMDRLSLWLVIAKQATNGVLNVAVGEILYAAVLSALAANRALRLPRMPIEAFVMMILASVILVPTTVFLALDAPGREAEARGAVGRKLSDGLQIAAARLGMWQESRGLMISAVASEWRHHPGPARVALPAQLRAEFARVAAYDAAGRLLWSGGGGASGAAPAAADRRGRGDARIVELAGPAVAGDRALALLVPARTDATTTVIVAQLRPGVLQGIVVDPRHESLEGLLLVSPSGRSRIVDANSPFIAGRLAQLPGEVRTSARGEAALLSMRTYGNAVMSDLRDALMVKAAPIDAMPGWEAVGVARLSGRVLEAREGQSQLFIALSGFVVLVAAAGFFLGKRLELSLRQIAQSAANLALLGTRPDKIDRLVISELSDLSVNIASVGSQVARERGALIAYQRRLRSIAEHAPVIVYALAVENGRKAGLTYVSESVGKILGYSPDETAEAGWWSRVIHPDDRDHCQSVFADLQPGKIVRTEYRLRHKQGHYVWVFDNLAVEYDPILCSAEAVGLLIDISERKIAAEQLVQADKMASLGRMISGVAHELNQPLNFIKMAAMNLGERTGRGLFDAGHFSAKLDKMIAQVNRASAIILQMRVFGRKPTEAPYPMAVTASIDGVMTMVRPQLDADCIRVELVECDPGLKVRALPVLLEQVLLNLILNAHDAIRSRHQSGDMRPGWIRISAVRKDWHAIITIDDNGTGLPEETIPILFEPFFTTKPPKEGTGLGLSISYGIIRDLGGTIRAENMPVDDTGAENTGADDAGAKSTGAGARFVIELPLAV